MSDGGSSGGFDSGPSGGFDTGGGSFDSGFGGGFDTSGRSDSFGLTDPAPSMGGTAFDGTHGPGSPLWMHQQHLQQDAHLHPFPRRSGGGSLPTSPVGIVSLIIFGIIALVVFANFSSGSEDLYPGTPTGEVIDGGPMDGGFDVPTTP